MTLDEYFHKIINPTKKEASMLTKLKQYWTDKFSFVDKDPSKPQEDCWSFQMYTEAWEESDEKLSTITEPTDGTWMEQLDKILDVMSEHYGYDIKSQVYYSVAFPMNIEGEAGYTRSLNDEVLQKLLLAYPEVYELDKSFDWKPL